MDSLRGTMQPVHKPHTHAVTKNTKHFEQVIQLQFDILPNGNDHFAHYFVRFQRRRQRPPLWWNGEGEANVQGGCTRHVRGLLACLDGGIKK